MWGRYWKRFAPWATPAGGRRRGRFCPEMAEGPGRSEDSTQRRREAQRGAESSFSLRFSAFLCVSALRQVWQQAACPDAPTDVSIIHVTNHHHNHVHTGQRHAVGAGPNGLCIVVTTCSESVSCVMHKGAIP